MEPTQLQLVLNVVTITGMTSLAGYCYLLKRENRKLATERKTDSQGDVRQAQVSSEVETVIPPPRKLPATKPVTVPIQGMGQDIRNFAAGRRSGWVKNLASSIS